MNRVAPVGTFTCPFVNQPGTVATVLVHVARSHLQCKWSGCCYKNKVAFKVATKVNANCSLPFSHHGNCTIIMAIAQSIAMVTFMVWTLHTNGGQLCNAAACLTFSSAITSSNMDTMLTCACVS